MPRAEPIAWSMDIEPGVCAVCCNEGSGVVVGSRDVGDDEALRLWRCLSCDSVTIGGGRGDLEPTQAQIDEYVTGAGGLDSIIANLYRADRRTTRSLLDVGCNVGFGVHYAQNVLGWRAVGIEPSRAGAWGAEHLGIDVRPILLDASTELGETFDLVVASEVLEHVPDARAFVAALGRQLAPGGVLVLTTPDSDRLDPTDPSGSVQIVGVGEHRFLASREGLRRLLAVEGFASVAFGRSGLSHVVVAARERGRALDADAAGPRIDELSTYFADVARAATDPMLRYAMLNRAYVAAVAVGTGGCDRIGAVRRRTGSHRDRSRGARASRRGSG